MTQAALDRKRREIVEQVRVLPLRARQQILRSLVRELKQLEAINEMGQGLKHRGFSEKDLVRIALEQS